MTDTATRPQARAQHEIAECVNKILVRVGGDRAAG